MYPIMFQMLDWQSSMSKLAAMDNDVMCDMAGKFFDMMEYAPDVNKVKMKGITDRTVAIYCQMDPRQLIEELNNKTDFEALVSQVRV